MDVTSPSTERSAHPALPAIASAPLPLRIALLTNILLPHRVDLLTAFAPYVQHLRIFLSATNEPNRKEAIDWRGLDVVVQKAIRWKRTFQNIHGFEDTSFIQVPYDAYPLLQRFHPHLVLSGEFGARTLLAVLYRILHPRTRLIVWATLSQRTEQTRGGLRLRLRRLILAHADACFAHGHDGEAYLRGLNFTRPVFHIPYATDPARFAGERSIPPEGTLRLLFAGQLVERKGILPFTHALAAWCAAHPGTLVHFTIAGEGDQRTQLEALPLPPSLRLAFPGHLDATRMRDAYLTHSLYVFPTLADEWGLVVNESLSAGLPILASRHAQASIELVHNGENGWLFDPLDPTDMAQALNRALTTPPEALQTMSQNARASISSWTPAAIAQRMANAIRTLTGAA